MAIFTHDGQVFTIRVLKIRLASGETETLLTNLIPNNCPFAAPVSCTLKRWGIETAPSSPRFRWRISPERPWSAYTRISMPRCILPVLPQPVPSKNAGEHIAALDEKKQLKYHRKVSQNRTIVKLRERFWLILLKPNDALRTRMLDRLCLNIASRPESIRPGCSQLHKQPRSKRFHMAKKAVLPLVDGSGIRSMS